MNFKHVFGRDLLRTVFQKGIVTAVIAIMVPTSAVVAEPSFGTQGSQALSAEASVVAQPSITRFIGRTMTFEISAYTASVEETDDSPCFTANMTNICNPANFNTVATNDLPLGTVVIIDGETKIVNDRMNDRYTGKKVMDVLVQSKAEARQVGRTLKNVTVLY